MGQVELRIIAGSPQEVERVLALLKVEFPDSLTSGVMKNQKFGGYRAYLNLSLEMDVI